jgi:hypothetical protein
MQKRAIPLCLASLIYAGIAPAKVVDNLLGSPANAIDVYQTRCSENNSGATELFVANVTATSAGSGAVLSVQVYKGRQAAQATDRVSGDRFASPNAIIKAGGEGVYTIFVDKHDFGANTYRLNISCQTAGGKPSGQSTPRILQNQ